ncbi:hypothetical protein GALL_56480 [mine drainage metagenome]|uniref:Fibronectin type-III domain-containing protein n=1 Tax=mine drainage metagenome TaxID=410659 RepID=A0A1J5SXQ2_9ZZZZ
MATPRVKVSFSTYTDSGFYQKSEHILQSMTGNPNFATPTPTLADVQTAITKYSDALGKVIDGTKQDTVLKNQARKELEALLHDLGLYVQLNGKNDEAIILSSGFDIANPRIPIGILPKPTGFNTGKNTITGCVDLELDPINGAKSYQFEYTDAPVTETSVWHVVTSTAAFITITGLVSGKEYAFRVTGVGSDPTRVYSNVLNKNAPY